MVTACARCGDVGFARKLFEEMPEKDPVTWNAMISGYAQVGESREALDLGCSVVGLVDEGQRHFGSMRSEFGIEPQLYHYGCLVYSRARRLEDPICIIQQMPYEASRCCLEFCAPRI
ncbi:hypothetical protein Bca4012_063642 [Brassica carinata]